MLILFEFSLKSESESFFGCLSVLLLSMSIISPAVLCSAYGAWVPATKKGNFSRRSQINEPGWAQLCGFLLPAAPSSVKALGVGALEQPPRVSSAGDQQFQHLVSGMIDSQT